MHECRMPPLRFSAPVRLSASRWPIERQRVFANTNDQGDRGLVQPGSHDPLICPNEPLLPVFRPTLPSGRRRASDLPPRHGPRSTRRIGTPVGAAALQRFSRLRISATRTKSRRRRSTRSEVSARVAGSAPTRLPASCPRLKPRGLMPNRRCALIAHSLSGGCFCSTNARSTWHTVPTLPRRTC